MPKLFQTPTAKKKGFWHITVVENDRCVYPICNSQGYYIGGYHKDKPEMTREAMPETIWDGTQTICPSCVLQAYKRGMIRIEFIDDKI